MQLPDAKLAIVEVVKLRDYCLSATHPRGRHKARVFAAALGITADDADWLREQILAAALVKEAVLDRQDEYGQRYFIDFTLEKDGRAAIIRASWIVRRDEIAPRLTSCRVNQAEQSL